MRKTIGLGLIAIFVSFLAGCGDNRIVGHRITQRGTWHGEFGVTGNLNQVHIRAGSKLTKLKIFGDMNKVIVEDRVPIARLEIWGENNVVSIPEYMRVIVASVGKGNRVIRRERGSTDYGIRFDESYEVIRPEGEMEPYYNDEPMQETTPYDTAPVDSGAMDNGSMESGPAQPEYQDPNPSGTIRTLPPGQN